MYLRGLNGFGKLVEDAAGNVYDDGTGDGSSPGVGDGGGMDQSGNPTILDTGTSGPSDTGPGATPNWTGLLTQALSTWGTIQGQKIQTQGAVQVAQAQGRYLPVPARVVSTPGYSPFLGATSGAGTLLLLAGVGVGAYLLMK